MDPKVYQVVSDVKNKIWAEQLSRGAYTIKMHKFCGGPYHAIFFFSPETRKNLI